MEDVDHWGAGLGSYSLVLFPVQAFCFLTSWGTTSFFLLFMLQLWAASVTMPSQLWWAVLPDPCVNQWHYLLSVNHQETFSSWSAVQWPMTYIEETGNREKTVGAGVLTWAPAVPSVGSHQVVHGHLSSKTRKCVLSSLGKNVTAECGEASIWTLGKVFYLMHLRDKNLSFFLKLASIHCCISSFTPICSPVLFLF